MMQQFTTTTLWYFFIGLFVFFWIFSLLWVAKDIVRRTKHLGTQILSVILIVLFTPIIGLPIYFLIRPLPRNELFEEQEVIKDMLTTQTIICAECDGPNLYEHTFCVFCGEKLKTPCPACGKDVAYGYFYCPFCSTDLDPEEKNDSAIVLTQS